MKNIFKYSITLVIVVSATVVLGQDVHFSQFYVSPLTLNPANTGDFKGDYRVSHIYRSQYKDATVGDNISDGQSRKPFKDTKPFRTINLGIDLPLYLGDHKFGVGFMFLNDQTGQAYTAYSKDSIAVINKTKLAGSLSYIKKVKGHKISIGIQPSYNLVNSKTNNSDVGSSNSIEDYSGKTHPVIGRMESGILGDPLLSNGSDYNVKTFDLNAGIMWSKKFGKFEPIIGFSMFHIIQPKESLLKENTRLPNRNVFSFGGTYEINATYFIMPNVLAMVHKRAQDFIYGFNIAYRIADNERFNYVYLGPEFRHSFQNADAAILTVGANLNKWNVGLSRDFTISNLKTGTGGTLGAWELSVIFTAPETLLQKKAIPCDRY